MVAYVNIGCYYLIGIPLGILLGWLFNLGVLVRCEPCSTSLSPATFLPTMTTKPFCRESGRA